MNVSESSHDVIVIGGGAIGLAAAYHATAQGARVVVLEQAGFSNQDSSSAGATRQFRIQYSEDYMARLVLQSIPYWEELQKHSRAPLLSDVGSIWFGDPDVSGSEGQIKQAMEVMKRLKIPFEPLTAEQVEQRYGFAGLPRNYLGFFQKGGGTINVPLSLEVMLTQIQASGRATLCPRQSVKAVKSSADGVLVATANGDLYRAGKLILAIGPCSNRLRNLLDIHLDLTIWQMVSCYFKKRKPTVDFPSWFVFEEEKPDDAGLYYGFEEVPWSNPGYIRVAPAFAKHVIRDPDERTPEPDPGDIALTSQWVGRHMPGLDPTPSFTSSCLAALPIDPDKKMFLDFAPGSIPGSRNIVIFAGGWAYKFVPLLGRICADLALQGRTQFDISPFQIPAERMAAVDPTALRRRSLAF